MGVDVDVRVGCDCMLYMLHARVRSMIYISLFSC